MSKTGCFNGCIHNKEIKLNEMKEHYSFRCDACGKYMKNDDVKKSCNKFSPEYVVKIPSIEDFLD